MTQTDRFLSEKIKEDIEYNLKKEYNFAESLVNSVIKKDKGIVMRL
jgi:hypothetical protein